MVSCPKLLQLVADRHRRAGCIVKRCLSSLLSRFCPTSRGSDGCLYLLVELWKTCEPVFGLQRTVSEKQTLSLQFIISDINCASNMYCSSATSVHLNVRSMQFERMASTKHSGRGKNREKEREREREGAMNVINLLPHVVKLTLP